MGFVLVPGNTEPAKGKTDLLPKNHWLRTRRYVNGEHTYRGRRKETVQEAILEFAKTNTDFPVVFDHDDPQQYFVQGTERCHVNEVIGRGIEVTPQEKRKGWIELPLVWSLSNLWDATNRYTNHHYERGAGRRYDDLFSFCIRMLKPDWTCHTSVFSGREYFWRDGPEAHLYEGLSRWEKLLKKQEFNFFNQAKDMNAYEIINHIERFLLVDHELSGFLGQFWWAAKDDSAYPAIRLLGLQKDSMRRIMDIWTAMDHSRKEWGRDGRMSDFDCFVEHCYMDLDDGLNKKLEEGLKIWKAADDLLQKAFCNEPYPDSGEAYSYVSKKDSCRNLLTLFREFWGGVRAEGLMRVARELRYKS